MFMQDKTVRPSARKKAVRQKLMLALACVTLLIPATGCVPKSPPTLAPGVSPTGQPAGSSQCNTSGDSAEVKAFKQEAERLFNEVYPVWSTQSNALWRNAWAMDTLLDYFAVCDVDASSYGDTVLQALNPSTTVNGWWDDFGWVGIAALRAAEQNISPDHRDDFLKVAINTWAYMYGPGWSKTNPAIFPFIDESIPGWKAFRANHTPNVGAPNVWKDIEQTWPGVTQDQKMQRKPRYSPGGAWNSTITDGSQPVPVTAYQGTGAYLNPIQNTVTNGLYAILTLRIYRASQNPAFRQVFSESGLDPDACLQAWKDQIGWLNQWMVETTDTDESLLVQTQAGSLVRERVSTFDDGKYWDAAYINNLVWTGDQGLLIGALREGKAAGYLQPEPKVFSLYSDIMEGVFKNGYRPRTYGTVTGSFLLPWMMIGPGDAYTARPPGGDTGDYLTGNAVFMRYLLQAYKADPDLVKGYKDDVLSSARSLVKIGDNASARPPGRCNAYTPYVTSFPTDEMTAPVNRLSELLLAIEMSD